jgi:hypothetical protein
MVKNAAKTVSKKASAIDAVKAWGAKAAADKTAKPVAKVAVKASTAKAAVKAALKDKAATSKAKAPGSKTKEAVQAAVKASAKAPVVSHTKRGRPSERRSAFIRLGQSRTDKAVNAVRLIGNLSNINDYEYTADDVAKVFRAVEDEIAAAKARFHAASQTRKRAPLTLSA